MLGGGANIFAAPYDIVPTGHSHAEILARLLATYALLPASFVALVRTTVMGMLGALGKTNLTSSNFPRRRQLSASDTLLPVSPLVPGPIAPASIAAECRDHSPSCSAVSPMSAISSHKLGSRSPPVAQSMRHDYGRRMLLQSRHDQRLFSSHFVSKSNNSEK